MNKLDDTFLARWLNNELSEEELNQFISSEHYNTYVNILKGADQLKAPDYNLDEAYTAFTEKKNNTSIFYKNKYSKNKWQLSIAASLFLLIGLFTYFTFFKTTQFSSDYGNQLAFDLPDGSKVLLNSKSTITYNNYNWKKNRVLQLDGEAFFDVEKGSDFIVKTTQGNVHVLGTEFNVSSGNDFFKVTCFEGKVKVTDNTNNTNHILTPSLGYQKTKGNEPIALTFNSNKPDWLNNQSVFRSTPIKNVFEALEKQYHLSFKYNNFNDSLLFTGSFPNNNKEIALKSVLKSLNLKYTIQKNTIILED